MPSTTLLITSYNRGRLLRNSLEQLTRLTVPEEVLVVDDGGDDDTEAVCADFRSRLPLRYIHHDNPGPSICSFARNVGLREARGEIVITSEPEIVFQSDVIAQLLDRHEQYPNDVVSAGNVFFARSDSVPWEAAAPANPDFEQAVGWVATYTALYRRDWLSEIGGWDESFPGNWGWDDTDLLTRLRLCAHGQVIATDISVVHQWHPLGGDPDRVNEDHFFAKSFHADESDRTDIVANAGQEWGRLRMKTS